jgi:hypothetical protein
MCVDCAGGGMNKHRGQRTFYPWHFHSSLSRGD